MCDLPQALQMRPIRWSMVTTAEFVNRKEPDMTSSGGPTTRARRSRSLILCVSICAALSSATCAAARASAAKPGHDAPAATAPDNAPTRIGAARAGKEDWSTPSLATSHLSEIAPPLVVDKSEFADYTREMVHVQWRTFDPIYLYVAIPKNVPKPGLVLFLYSFPQTAKRFTDNEFCRIAVRNGMAAVGFESAMTGERYRNRPMKQWFVSELPEALASTAHDVQLILDYLAKRGDLDMSRVGMYAVGSGATIALLASGVDRRLKVLDLVDPWSDWPDWIAKTTRLKDDERLSFLKTSFLKSVTGLDPLLWLPKVQAEVVRITLIGSDGSVPGECREKLAKTAPARMEVRQFSDSAAHYRTISLANPFNWPAEQLRNPKSGAH